MPAVPCACPVVRPDAAELNAAIRALTAGRTVWDAAALVAWADLTAQWRKAVEAERDAA